MKRVHFMTQHGEVACCTVGNLDTTRVSSEVTCRVCAEHPAFVFARSGVPDDAIVTDVYVDDDGDLHLRWIVIPEHVVVSGAARVKIETHQARSHELYRLMVSHAVSVAPCSCVVQPWRERDS